ncbi:hypothetical protein WGP40_02190 [Brachymonas sp. G13]|uniref:hypothetical protein n=1 Tax=Brachymonas wangyanguii TaxID=3130163 RepID=UPI00307F62F8
MDFVSSVKTRNYAVLPNQIRAQPWLACRISMGRFPSACQSIRPLLPDKKSSKYNQLQTQARNPAEPDCQNI